MRAILRMRALTGTRPMRGWGAMLRRLVDHAGVGHVVGLTLSQAQARWYTSLQSCVRGAKLAGEVVAVSNVNGRFMTYGPKNWRNFLTTIDMNWVNARLNKELTCTF